MATWNLGETLASTLPSYETEFKDQVFNKHPVLDHFKNNGGVVKKGGGSSIRVPLMHSAGTSEWFSGSQSLNVNEVDTLDAAEYTWRNLNASIIFTLDDELNNNGKEQVVDLIEAKIKQAELTIADSLNDSLFNGTGVEARPRIVGLATALGTGTYAGIAGGTYTDWQAYVESTATALTVAHFKTMRNTINVGQGGAPVSIFATTQALFEKLESLYTPTYQMNPLVTSNEVKRLADVGFTSLGYAGVPVVFDPKIVTGSVYAVNPTNWKIFVHKDAYMDKTDRLKPIDQHVTAQHIVLRCALGTNRRKSGGALTGKTTS
jgi:hypothetical protein